MFLRLFFENDAKRLKNNAEKLKSDTGKAKKRCWKAEKQGGKAKKRCRKALKIIFRESSCGAVRSVDAAVLGVLR